jgi:Tfp pilus assembly protein PilO
MKKNLKSLNLQYFENVIDLKNKRTVQFTYLVLTIIALIFFGLFAINPTLTTIAKLERELDDNQFVDDQLGRKIQNLSSLQASFVTIQDDLPAIDASIPKNPQAPILIAQIQSVAKDENITLLSTQVFPVELDQNATKNKSHGTFSFIILGEGSNQSISAFVDRISKVQRVISLDQITLTKKADSSELLQISIRGSAYFKK